MEYYPPKAESKRLADYKTNEKVFLGEHFDAFTIKSSEFAKDYAQLKYIVCNFGGMLSKLSADMLFQEFPTLSLGDDGDSDWLEAFIRDNKFKTQAYESALEGSFRGDALFRLRSFDGIMYLEDINPACYFPKYNPSNLRAAPEYEDLIWEVSLGVDKRGIYTERHYKGRVETSLYEIASNGEIIAKLNLKDYYPDVDEVVQTGVDYSTLLFHIPNYKINSRYFGISDYYDLMSLFFAINNRMTKVDNILDKHGDPILAVPDGFLDDDGKVNRAAFGVIEVDTNEKQMMPQYIVWDAKLEAAYDEIDKLVEMLFMFSETSSAAIGMDKSGVAESGRALKFKLLRTIAKKNRKQLYYDDAFKHMFKVAQEFAKANNLTTQSGVKFSKDVQDLQIEWSDGVINDIQEMIDYEVQRIKNGLTSKVDAIQRLDGVSEDEAQKRLEAISTEKTAESDKNKPTFTATPERRPFGVGVTSNEVANNGGQSS